MLIVTEGKKTEPNYFKRFRQKHKLPSVTVKIIGIGGAPITVVEDAISIKNGKRSGYDEVWCVIDVEAYGSNPSLTDALRLAQTSKIKVALSNPCFEYWYLLHFESASRPLYTGKDAERALRVHIPDYDKSNSKIFDKLYPHTKKAIKRSKRVERGHERSGAVRLDRNPSTEVYKLVESLETMSEQPLAE